MNEQAVARVEKKYDISLLISTMINNRLNKILPQDVHNQCDGYMVRSLYFDTIYSDDLKDKEAGLLCRRKIRLRCYNPHDEYVKLERKHKEGQYQYKQSLNIRREDAVSMINGDYSCLLRIENAFARELYAIMTSELYVPKVIIEYKRKAFALSENNIRITIDSDIKSSLRVHSFFDEDISLSPFIREPILEVKYNNFLFDYIKRAIDVADKCESSISKYQLACSECYI